MAHDKITEQSLNAAAQGSDLTELESLADHARIAIARSAQNADVTFEGAAAHVKGIAGDEIVAVRQALTTLEGRIAELRVKDQPKSS
jgi:hypothetical protein